MKVIHLISGGDSGGAKTHVLSLLRELNKYIKPTLICFREAEFSKEARELGIDIRVLTSGRIDKDLAEIKKIISQEGCDILHCHGSRGNFIGALLKKSFKIPVVSTVHSDYRLDYMGRPFGKLVYGTLNTIALHSMDYFTGVSDSMAELLISRGFSPEKIFTIYNGIDYNTVQKKDCRTEYLAQFGIPSDCIVAGISARLNPVKDIATLIKAFAKAEKVCPQLRLMIAGDGLQEEYLKNLAKTLNVSDKVYFIGWVEDMDSFYSSIDINTLTSLSETFPYALTEGARMWLPTVASRVGGIPALIDSGVNGYLFDAGDDEALAEHLVSLAGSDEKRRIFGQKLGEKARRYFSLEETGKTQIRIYERILGIEARKKEKRKRDGVLICGAYGRGNSGDEAILQAIIAELREIDENIPVCVLSKDPKNTRMRHRVRSVYAFNILKVNSMLRKTKLYINGGGSLMQDVTSRRSLWFYLYTIWAAHRYKNRVIMYGCGAGPVTRQYNRELTGKILSRNVDIITLREDNSLETLKSYGVSGPEMLLSADPSLTLPQANEDAVSSAMFAQNLSEEGKYICFALRLWNGFDEKAGSFAAMADYVFEKYGFEAVFLPIENKNDVQAAKKVCEKMSTPYHIIDAPASPEITIGLMSKMQAVVSMRLHGLIFSAKLDLPTVGIIYDPKVEAFMHCMHQKEMIRLEEVCDERLKQLADTALSCRESENRVQTLLERESINTDSLRKLLN